MMRAVVIALALSAGCSYTFDGEAPALPLVGGPPPSGSFQRLNRGIAKSGASIIWEGSVPWVYFTEDLDTPEGKKEGYRAIRLYPPEAEEEIWGPNVQASSGAFYLIDRDPPTMEGGKTRITIRTPGHPPGDTFEMPGGPGFLIIGGGDRVFAYFPTPTGTPTGEEGFYIQWRDRSYQRFVKYPEGVEPAQPTARGSFFFESNGRWMFMRDGTGRLVRLGTRSETTIELGMHPRTLALDEPRRRLVTCGDAGVQQVPYDGNDPVTTLDPRPCESRRGLWFYNHHAYYHTGGVLTRVHLDGGRQPERVIDPSLRLLGFGPQGQIIHSTDPADRYVHQAGDGWIGDWRFMERGRDVYFTPDFSRVYWLEHAAKNTGVGDLMSAVVPGGEPLKLARNVRQYDPLPDGRVIAASNRAFRGTHNRVIVIDEERREARWVADMASEYTFIPGTRAEVILDVTSGATGYDIVRAPMPAK